MRRNTVTAGRQLVATFSSYLKLPLADPLRAADVDLSGEYYSTVEALIGRRIRVDEATLEAIPAGSVTAAEMGIAAGAPLLHRQRVLRLDGDEVLEYGIGYQRGDRIRAYRTRSRD